MGIADAASAVWKGIGYLVVLFIILLFVDGRIVALGATALFLWWVYSQTIGDKSMSRAVREEVAESSK